MYLARRSEKKKEKEIPENPTGEWIDANTSWVYLGGDVVPADVPKTEWTETVILHERLDGENAEKEKIILGFLDDHAERVKRAEAIKLIEKSKKTLDAARVGGGTP